MAVKKSPSICEKGPKVAAIEALSKDRRANLCNCGHKCAGTPVAIVGAVTVASPWRRHGSLS